MTSVTDQHRRLLAGVDELSSTNAWAVGNSAAGTVGEGKIDNEPLIEHWDGKAWSMVSGASLPAGTLAGALLTAGSASAASRGFIIRNDSNTAITVDGARGIPRIVCIGFKCVPGNDYPIDFPKGVPQTETC